MPIVTISRGSYSRGKQVAEKVAQKLGYECIAREILLEASTEFKIPEVKLVRAIHDAPSILDRFTYGRERYVAYIQAALLRHFQKDNVVYHGLAGQFFVRGIAHVLKVRIIADWSDRVRLEMEREGISEKEAARILRKDDQERRSWSKSLYGIDTWDSSIYDMVIHIHKITADDAADIICHAVGLEHFRTTPQSQKAIDDLVVAAEVKATLIDLKPDVEVSAQNGDVRVKAEAPESLETTLIEQMKKAARAVPGVKKVRINILPSNRYGG